MKCTGATVGAAYAYVAVDRNGGVANSIRACLEDSQTLAD